MCPVSSAMCRVRRHIPRNIYICKVPGTCLEKILPLFLTVALPILLSVKFYLVLLAALNTKEPSLDRGSRKSISARKLTLGNVNFSYNVSTCHKNLTEIFLPFCFPVMHFNNWPLDCSFLKQRLDHIPYLASNPL